MVVSVRHYQSDGLSNGQHTRLTMEKRPHYTWIYVTLPDPPENFKGYKRSFFSTAAGLPASPPTQLAAKCLLREIQDEIVNFEITISLIKFQLNVKSDF